MNKLSKSEVLAENKLFATLDTTVRKVVIKNLPFLLTDTVGFIRKLPHQLIESFKSTLDEVREADLLMHVIDISNNNFEDQIQTVEDTLNEIGVLNKPSIYVFNKIDKYNSNFGYRGNNISLTTLKDTWFAKKNNISVFISALNKEYFNELKDIMYENIKSYMK